ncbi:MAG: peptidoglycan DD-metalloendopeptidase family protein [Oscillospiraceae bacterium]|nr:peptidoglycan DD-metalloendopeptidase family protein [Oscillospiraceae bacterium]
MKNKSLKRFLLSAICCFISVIMIVLASPVVFADETDGTESSSEESENPTDEEYREAISDLQDEQVKIQEEMDAYKSEINSIKDEKKKQQALVNSIDAEIDFIQKSIDVTRETIAVTEQYIADKIAEIEAKEADIEYTLDLFRQRMRAIYMTGGYSDSTNSLLMLITSSSISEFLTRSEYLTRIAAHDEEMLIELRDELVKLEDEKAVLEGEKAALETEKAELEAQEAELEKKLNEAKSSIQDLSAMQKEYEANYEELSALQKQIQAELLDIYKNLNTSNEAYVGGEMMWPVPGYSKISSYYGWRFNNTDFHTGVDITGAGVHGAPVVAANTGTVVHTKVIPYNGYKYGYGTYIIVDHGGGITTLYAHLSAIDVKVGDIVVMGQQIGRVGNTGWSTGAHLHFEVRVDGTAVNPIGYIT